MTEWQRLLAAPEQNVKYSLDPMMMAAVILEVIKSISVHLKASLHRHQAGPRFQDLWFLLRRPSPK